MNAANWFNNLPASTRLNFGTQTFDKEVFSELEQKCFHPILKNSKDCSKCKTTIENVNLETLIKQVKIKYSTHLSQEEKNATPFR